MAVQVGTILEDSVECKVHLRRLDNKGVNLASLTELFAGLPTPAVLGANEAKTSEDGFSYWVAQPREIFEFHFGQDNPFNKLDQLLDKYQLSRPCCNLPKGIFCGGWIGYFGYDLARYIERLGNIPTDDIGLPVIRLCFYDKLICYDHKRDSFWLVVLELPGEKDSVSEKFDWLEDKINLAEYLHIAPFPSGLVDAVDLSSVRCNMDRRYYLESFKKIQRCIFDGLVYQVNFSQRFECCYNGRAVDLFHWQSQFNPSGYAAYISSDDFAIVSASPEMFITITNGWISTKPIKGTRPKLQQIDANSRKANERNYHELLFSEKEQAELNMIIDLERNDLAKICQPGTRGVIQPRTIESYPTVFHAVATIAGQLRPEVSFCDVLRAVFPGGSITGAPKVSAMQIIGQTEPTARGVYTGSIGYIGVDGNVCLNIAIRTIIVKANRAYVQTGGGIVADSDPQAEWDETLVKARALLAGINCVQNKVSNR